MTNQTTKIKIHNFQSTFNLRCPRCGNDLWSVKTYNSGAHTYHKCGDCGADVYAEECKTGGTDIGMVVEKQYANYDNTHESKKAIHGRISKDLKESVWRMPE
jgi:transcription elongation factor Elf1